jgi:hypothetical protein
MLKKIISGGQTGADQAALDAAIKLDIPYGGWLPKGRLTENGPLPQKYELQELSSQSYAERTEKNVLESDGTLIISHGRLTGGSEYTADMAVKHGRVYLHVDLEKISAFQGALMIRDWLHEHHVEILNVAGPRASKDSNIYAHTFKILQSVAYLELVKNPMSGAAQPSDAFPQTVDTAVDRLVSEMPLKDKATMANMTEAEWVNLDVTLGKYIMNQFGLWSGNQALIKSCRAFSQNEFKNEEEAANVIIQALWQRLQNTHKLRVVK